MTKQHLLPPSFGQESFAVSGDIILTWNIVVKIL